MNEAAAQAKQQIVDKIKSSTNILVVVSKNPSVDELAAAVGLSTLLNKADKHVTAIFSGEVPAALNFLNPEKVFDNKIDSLRDFIISLDKEKADHLRYKVEGDVVKIFITPYRTVINSDDLQFSQGDYNVELVIALGVSDREHLDTAMAAHGQILHDVTVATLSDNERSSQLGSLAWQDSGASSLSEMVAGIGESLKSDKAILDKQIATAILTGIVAATDRFSNTRTTSRVMSVAAQMMAAGADQQLISAKLQEVHAIRPEAEAPAPIQDVPQATPRTLEQSAETVSSTLPPDNLTINHDTNTESTDNSVSTLPEAVPVESTVVPEAVIDTTPQPDYRPEEKVIQPLDEQFQSSTLPPVENSSTALQPTDVQGVDPGTIGEPALGGTLNATADQAAEEARRELEDPQNRTILAHSYLNGDQGGAVNVAPINGVGQAEPQQDVDIFANMPPVSTPQADNLPLPPPQIPDFSTLPPPPLPNLNTAPPAPNLGVEPVQSNNDPSQFKIPGQ
jgi:hypothetical protein